MTRPCPPGRRVDAALAYGPGMTRLRMIQRDELDARWIHYSVNRQALEELRQAFGEFFDPDRIHQVLLNLYLNAMEAMEASGTSGMKAAINGVLNLSVPDGWWPEVYNGKNGCC